MKYLIDGSAFVFSDVITGVQRLEIEITQSCLEYWADTLKEGYLAIPRNGDEWSLLPARKVVNLKGFEKFMLDTYARLLCFRSLTNLVHGSLPSLKLKNLMSKYYSKRTRHLILFPGLIWAGFILLLALPYVILYLKPQKWRIKKNDALVVMYSNWGDDIRRQNYEKSRTSGARVYHFVHDVIPLDYPQFFTSNHVQIYKDSLLNTLKPADGFITNSAYTSSALKAAAQKYYNIDINALPTCEIPINKTTLPTSVTLNEVREKLKSLAAEPHIYLVVGTIEPRKNHHYILDAFELVWKDDPSIPLILVGKQGWNNADIIERICKHKMYGKSLYWFNDASDNELVYLYKNVSGIIMASIVEGFGLPIIEAQTLGCKTILSDIPVFREVGGNSLFFDLSKANSLSEIIQDNMVNTSTEHTFDLRDGQPSISSCITQFMCN